MIAVLLLRFTVIYRRRSAVVGHQQSVKVIIQMIAVLLLRFTVIYRRRSAVVGTGSTIPDALPSVPQLNQDHCKSDNAKKIKKLS